MENNNWKEKEYPQWNDSKDEHKGTHTHTHTNKSQLPMKWLSEFERAKPKWRTNALIKIERQSIAFQ